MALHELFGEGFAGLELRRGLRGSEDAMAALGEFIDDAYSEGEFGTDHCKGGLLDGDDVDHLVQVRWIARDAAGELSDTAVARSADHLCDLRRLAESPDQRVLTTTTTDYQNLHSLTHSIVENSYISRLGIVAVEVKRAVYFTATEIASASEWLSRAGWGEDPMRTW